MWLDVPGHGAIIAVGATSVAVGDRWLGVRGH